MLLKLAGNYYPNNLAQANKNLDSTPIQKSSGPVNVNQGALNLMAQAKEDGVGFFKGIVDFFKSYQFKEIVFIVKFIFIIISALLALLLFLLILKIIFRSPVKKTFKFVTKKVVYPSRSIPLVFNKKKIMKKIAKIDKRIESGVEENYKMALLEINDLFDSIVKNLGYGAEKKLSNITDIKAAGKLNKKIIEEKEYKLSYEDAKKSVDAYKDGLEELGVL
jgi:hypothetical protein